LLAAGETASSHASLRVVILIIQNLARLAPCCFIAEWQISHPRRDRDKPYAALSPAASHRVRLPENPARHIAPAHNCTFGRGISAAL
jgi:hypothetical protein